MFRMALAEVLMQAPADYLESKWYLGIDPDLDAMVD